MFRLTVRPKHHKIARKLAALDDVHAIGRLVDALEWPDAGIRDTVIAALERLLPRLRASDAALLSAQQRTTLHRMLTMANVQTYEEFLINLLAALEQVGDRSAVPYVQELIATRPLTDGERRVRDAAIECLPFLEQNADQTHNIQTLLRAAAPSAPAPQQLLRPAAQASDVDAVNLLRAADGGRMKEAK
jgi:hypothetical protein